MPQEIRKVILTIPVTCFVRLQLHCFRAIQSMLPIAGMSHPISSNCWPLQITSKCVISVLCIAYVCVYEVCDLYVN